MRTISGAERTLIGGSRFDVHLRAFIRDAGGTFRDLTNIHGGRNWLLGVTIRESLDSPSATASVTLSRTVDGLTIAPGVSGSSANSGGAFLDVGRELYVETACVAAGASPVAGDWRRVFWGRVDRLETGDRERIVLECRDLSGRLTDLFLEAPYQVPAVALETAIQGLLDASPLGNIVTLATPVSPSFTITSDKAPRYDAVSLLASARQMAAQVGWDLRYRWTGDATNELRLFQPDRAKTTPDLTIGPGEYLSVRSWAAALEDVRNVVTVQYRGANGLPATEIRSNGASITAYGRRAMRLGGDTTFLIRTQAQAQALGDAVLADLALPTATHQIETLYLWPVEVGDLWRFSPNAVHYDGNQDYAVVAIEHELSRDRHRTRVTARGRPAARYYGWLREGITAADVIAAAITNAAPGGNATQAEISYASSGGTLTVLKNGTAVTPGASPWVVNRPAAGVADVYEFIQTAGAVRESVTVTIYSNEMFSGGGYVGGSGTTGRLARWATASTLGDAVVEDDGTHFFPTVGSTRDNGTAARPWRDMRASRDVIAGGSLSANGGAFQSLGATARFHVSGGISLGGSDDFGAGIIAFGPNSTSFRPLYYNIGSGALRIRGNAGGGWAMGMFFDGSSGTNYGGFGALGNSDALTYYYMGASFAAPSVAVHASGGISLGDGTDDGAGTVRFAARLTFSAHATHDIGTSSVRPRDIYASRDVIAGGTLSVAGDATLGGDPGGAERLRITGGIRTTTNSVLGGNVMFNNPTGAARFRNTASVDASDDLGVYRSGGRWLLAGWGTGLGVQVDTATGDAWFGGLRFLAHATHDIGTSSVRPRDGWFSRDLTVGGAVAASGDMTKRGSTVPRVVISATTPTGTFQDGDLWIVP